MVGVGLIWRAATGNKTRSEGNVRREVQRPRRLGNANAAGARSRRFQCSVRYGARVSPSTVTLCIRRRSPG